MNLIIVESPTKARTLSRFLKKDYSVQATMGHIKDLPKSKLGVDIEHAFKPSYLVVRKKIKSIKSVKDDAVKASNIYIATDPDREGEAIAYHVAQILRNKKVSKAGKVPKAPKASDTFDTSKPFETPIKRIVFHEITKKAVEDAIVHPRDIDNNLVDAQIARRVLDRLVGYKLSPLLWKKVRRGLSAGRVQTVTVRLIVEREREIEAFIASEYWEIYCEVSREGKMSKAFDTFGTSKPLDTFTVKLVKIDDKKAEIGNQKTANLVVSDLKKSKYTVDKVVKREVKKYPLPPFTTSTMTQTASRRFYWSAKKTMSIAQRLYEEGLITYHRTDSTNLSSLALKKVREYIGKEFGANYLPEKMRFFKTKAKVAQEAHEAVRPTNVARGFEERNEKISKDDKTLYELIWKRFVACQMKESVYDETKIDVKADKYLLRAIGQIMKFDGWKKVYQARKEAEKVELPAVEKGESLDLIKIDPQQKFTEPPKRYSEASLIKKLEELGIGRPSTYAPTISIIQVRNYVEKKEGKFYSTPVGITVNDFLIKHFAKVFDYGFTARMEDDLDKIANGKSEWVSEIKTFWGPFEKKLDKVTEKSKRVKIETEKLGKECPKCNKGELVIRIGRFGKFVSCSRFPDCDHREKYLEKIGINCPECKKGEVIIKTTKRGRKFYGCSRYPKCNWASWRKPLKEVVTRSK